RVTFGGTNGGVFWTPDSKRFVFSSTKDGRPNLYWKAADGNSPEEQLTKSEHFFLGMAMSPDQVAAYVGGHSNTGRDIYVMPVAGDRQARPWLQTPADETVPAFSPDGRWIAYCSNETGRFEVFVRPYPGPGEKRQISTEGGEGVMWGRDGK